MADGAVERVVVTVDPQHSSSIQSVASALQAAGMRIKDVLNTSGIITGEVSQVQKDALKAVPGVKAVESDEEMRAT